MDVLEAELYSVVVIGRGLIGSAVAKYAAVEQGLRVAVVGPGEPTSSDEYIARDIFGAHYDEARITRCTDPDPAWAALAAASVDCYRDIEERSGIDFYHEVGQLSVGSEHGTYIDDVATNADAAGVDCERLSSQVLAQRFPFLRFDSAAGERCTGIFERQRAGWVSARRLVEAQTRLAQQRGCEIIHDDVMKVHRASDGSSGDNFVVTTTGGRSLLARRVLVCCGAFTNSRPLLPAGPAGSHVELDIELRKTQAILVEISPDDLHELKNMPSVIFKNTCFWCYMLPPVQYPDGKTYLKLGGEYHGGSGNSKVLTSHGEVVDWYRSAGDPASEAEMVKIFSSLLPTLKPLSVRSLTCVLPYTCSRHLFVDGAFGCLGLGVVAGCNGFAAKSSDAIGKLAATALLSSDGWGKQLSSLPRDRFRPVLRSSLRPEATANENKSKTEYLHGCFTHLYDCVVLYSEQLRRICWSPKMYHVIG